MTVPAESNQKQHFTAFVDLLGFAETSSANDDTIKSKVLAFLVSLSALRGEFNLKSVPQETGTINYIKPAVSTFSDHIVISYPLDEIAVGANFDEKLVAVSVLFNFNQLLARIASAALSIGFLIRGGATIGNLYPAEGVVFGEALVEAFRIESRTAVYPSVVLSSAITSRDSWKMLGGLCIARCNDGLFHFNYVRDLLLDAVPPGDSWAELVRARYRDSIRTIARNLAELESEGRLYEFAKWAWFAREFRSAVESLPEGFLNAVGISPTEIVWSL